MPLHLLGVYLCCNCPFTLKSHRISSHMPSWPPFLHMAAGSFIASLTCLDPHLSLSTSPQEEKEFHVSHHSCQLLLSSLVPIFCVTSFETCNFVSPAKYHFPILQISVFIIFVFISPFCLETLLCFVLPFPDLISAFYSSFKTILSCPLEHLFNHNKLLLTSSFFSSPESGLSHFPLSPSYWRWLITPQFLNSRIGRGVTCLPYTFPPLDRYFSTLFYSFLFL